MNFPNDPYQFGQLMAGFCDAVRHAPAYPEHGVANMLVEILTELHRMSDTQNQQSADVAQMTSDISTLTGGFKALTDKIAELQTAATAAAGTVPADLQAKITELHAFAQSVAPAPVANPTPAAPVADSTPPVTDPATTATTPPADTTAQPTPTDPAPAAPVDGAAPTGTATPL
jgi:ABC-type transporter Mla subunit MlaD